MKQMSDVETTTSSRPAFRGFAAASLMACLISSEHRVETPPVVPQAPSRFKASRPGFPDARRRRRLSAMHRVVAAAELFYRRHPISEAQVLDALRRQGKDPAKLSPEDLYEWDQDHY